MKAENRVPGSREDTLHHLATFSSAMGKSKNWLIVFWEECFSSFVLFRYGCLLICLIIYIYAFFADVDA